MSTPDWLVLWGVHNALTVQKSAIMRIFEPLFSIFALNFVIFVNFGTVVNLNATVLDL